ncbi:MAG: Mu transposase C-terminal domain-containing protein [Verrucomicrobiota bacterium]|nr:Mu transposase C-terminal domain-containing protein [Verrucomicrobiota bacterium]
MFEEIDASETNQYLKGLAQKEVVFPDGREGKPSLSTLRRKLNCYRRKGFTALARRPRADRGKARSVSSEALAFAIELKCEQPRRSHKSINRFLNERFGVTVPKSTLYRHLRAAGATRLKLGIVRKPVRKRWTREHTHDLWVGDFEEGPYVLVDGEATATHLSAFIDCHSRYVVEARYYLRQNLDILIDSLLRAFAVHGVPKQLYLDNAKVYHAKALKAACCRLHVNLIYRPAGDPSPGGLIEAFFRTTQEGFEAEARKGDILELKALNRAFSAWLEMDYHGFEHSEIKQTPKERYSDGLTVIRQVDLNEAHASFMRSEHRRVHRDFADVQLDKRLYRVDPKLRGDKVEVRYDPFGILGTVQIYSLDGHYLGEGVLHHRQSGGTPATDEAPGKPKHNYLDLLVNEHEELLDAKSCGIDYRKITRQRAWPYTDFVKTFAHLLGKKGGLSAFNAGELEALKKLYNRDANLDKRRLQRAFAKAQYKTIVYVAYELRQQTQEEE